jgi:hypothetical protein
MTFSETDTMLLVVVALVALLAWSVWVAASRLDRLHRKVLALRAVVDTQLVRRASAAAELAASGLLDPVSAVLVGESAWAVLSAGGLDDDELARMLPGVAEIGADAAPDEPEAIVDRGLAESELSATLRAALDDPAEVEALREEPGGHELLGALAASWYRVQLARRFHNEAVAQAQRMRRTFLARVLHLAGHAPVPQTVELDDGWPEALGRPGASIQTDRPAQRPSV